MRKGERGKEGGINERKKVEKEGEPERKRTTIEALRRKKEHSGGKIKGMKKGREEGRNR